MKRLTLITLLLGMFLHANAYHWDVNINKYPNNMSIVGVVAIDGVEQTSSTLEVGAFCGGECRGREMVIGDYYSMFNHYYLFLTVYGNDGDALVFRIYDHATGEELVGNCINTETFVTNGTLGDPGTPYVLNYLSPSSFTITAVADPTAGGTITGAGTYENGESCTLVATANANYAFLNWTLNGTVVSSEPTYTFTVNGDAHYVAHFTSQFTYTIATTSNPTEAGVLTGSGNYLEGTSCTLTAVPANIGYTFINWTKNGTVVSTNSTYTFVVTENAEYVANFQINSFHITANVTPSDAGTVSGGGSYNWGTTCTLTATANSGYTFSYWLEDGVQVSDNATYSFVVNGNRTLVAQFEESTTGDYHWDVNIHQFPTTMTFFSIIEIDGEEQLTDQLEIGAFSGDVCRGRERPTDMYYQMFNHYYMFLTVYGNDGDAISFRLYDHRIGQELNLNCSNTVIFSSNASYGDPVAPYVFDFFSQVVSHTINASANPEQGGTITGTGSYAHGTQCTLTATANTGYAFNNWTENGTVVSTNASYSFTVTDDRTLVANFTNTPVNYTINATASPAEGGTVSGTGTFLQGSTCTLTATANTGYTFNNWTENGQVVSSEASYSFTVTGNRTLVANFEEVSSEYHWDVNIHTYPTTMTIMGIVNIDDVEQFSNYLEIGAFCNNECRGREKTSDLYYNMIGHYVVFLTVYGNEGDLINYRLYDHSIGQELDLTCLTIMNFTVNASYGDPINPFPFNFVSTIYYDVTAEADPTEGGSIDGTGSYEENTQCTLTATSNTGYSFVNWTLDDVEVSTDSEYTFVVTEDTHLVAHFSLNSYAITAESNPTVGGSVSGTGNYYHFQTCTLTATANTGYTFLKWIKDGETVSTQSAITFTVEGPAHYVAQFELNSYDITAQADPTEGGSVSGAGTYNHFETCTLTATPAVGYHFVNWTNDTNINVGSNNVISFEVTGPSNFIAHFELNSYVINVEAYPSYGGTATGGGTFVHGSSCTLTANPEEQFNFLNWTKDGVPVSTEQTYTFTVTEGGTYVANFERITVTQTTSIFTGWNWYSTYIEQEDINGLEMLEQSLGTIGKRIKAQDGSYVENYPVIGWIGLLSELNNESSYQILATGDGISNITGPVVHPSDHPITLYPGWNWIGYPCINSMDITTAFSNLTPTPNDQVKIADVYANYYPTLGWFGLLQNFEPGMGLLYFSRNTEPITFTYPEIDRYTPSVKNTVADDSHWFADRYAYPSNMTISAVVELDGEELSSENYELAAFANGECRGSVKLTYFEPLNRYLALLVVSGDETTSLQFGLYNSETGIEIFCSDFISYTTNAAIGTPMEPFKVAFNTNTGMNEFSSTTQLYPNPVESGKNFSIGTSAESEIQVEIMNAMGSVLREENLLRQPASITAPSVAGIYTLRITADGKTCYKKLIVK